jgi:hypothetical protein
MSQPPAPRIQPICRVRQFRLNRCPAVDNCFPVDKPHSRQPSPQFLPVLTTIVDSGGRRPPPYVSCSRGDLAVDNQPLSTHFRQTPAVMWIPGAGGRPSGACSCGNLAAAPRTPPKSGLHRLRSPSRLLCPGLASGWSPTSVLAGRLTSQGGGVAGFGGWLGVRVLTLARPAKGNHTRPGAADFRGWLVFAFCGPWPYVIRRCPGRPRARTLKAELCCAGKEHFCCAGALCA